MLDGGHLLTKLSGAEAYPKPIPADATRTQPVVQVSVVTVL